MGALTQSLLLLLRLQPLDEANVAPLVEVIVCGLAKQSVERISRLREV